METSPKFCVEWAVKLQLNQSTYIICTGVFSYAGEEGNEYRSLTVRPILTVFTDDTIYAMDDTIYAG